MFLRILDRLEEILIATLIAVATVVIFVAVVHRYAVGVPWLYPLVFDINLTWAQELCIYLFVWMAKFGAPASMSVSMSRSICSSPRAARGSSSSA